MADLVVYFKRPNFWRESVNIYYWNTQPKSSSVEWPGVAMTEEGDNWYSYRFSGIEEASFLFNDGNRRQTGDFWRDQDGWFMQDSWYDRHPDTEATPLVVHFKRPASWEKNINIYYWETRPSSQSVSWPGVAMTAEGNDWYRYEFAEAETAKFLINDGSWRQTKDLTRSREGWYLKDSWSDQNPQRPALPVIIATPKGATYQQSQLITLSSNNDDDAIYYTTDGSQPTVNSTLYEQPISIEANTTLRCLGRNALGEIGAIFEFIYTTDPNADFRKPRITTSVNSGTYLEAIAPTFTIKDDREAAVVAYYTNDGTEPTRNGNIYIRGNAINGLTGPKMILDKTTNVRFLVIDGAGNETYADFYYNVGDNVEARDFREETIYFLLTTRFYDGDPSNNFFCRDRIKFNNRGEAEDPHWRGDFKGLIQKLDYIKDLGFTAIWITPPVENRSGLDYHGYHAYDWTQIDARLESPDATYQDLINEAHARGLKIIQDVVVNHSCQYGIRGKVWIDHLPVKYYVPHGLQQGRIKYGPYKGNLGNYQSEFREDNDNPVAPDWFKERQTSDPEGMVPLVDPVSGETVPKEGYNPNRFFGIDANNLDPNWYHQDGFMSGGDWESVAIQTKHLAGDTIDLATRRDNVKDYLINAICQYLDMGVDALRIDTVKHVERNNLLEYIDAWKAHKPSLFVFGENLVKGTGWGDLFGDDNAPSFLRPWWYTRLGDDPKDPHSGGDSGFSVLDFSLFSTFRDNLSRGSFNGIGAILANDWVYGDATTLVTFLQNHDVGPDNDFRDRFRGNTEWAAAAYNLLWTIRGIPCLYYGEEIEFMKGKPQDIMGNDDTLDQTGRAYFGDHLEDDTIQKTQSHPLYQHIKRLNIIRSRIPALQKAPMSQVNEWGSGMSFVREDQGSNSYVVVGLTIGGQQQITINDVHNGTYRDAVTGNSIDVNSNSISFDVKANSAGIYVLNGEGKIGEDGVYLC
ncbi:starch-binding protein [Crocosphaera watsonii WH 8501]|uniref:Alpha amylase, catalytic region n=3 Tax=Crocosphaera watsonii TaxID=263511 RepID=Q4C795_CROWT|nr:starch-binding protein [Crocosphaera watsonii]EAM51723.1 Alpha amylase, catalytic region [Crocosphaera watsonii WH 8501]CCQ49680.1 Alpha-amylase precursor [Crocosphaera watsonii WH 8502]CCQ60305.1 Alpha-amylase precursor [Crocosphaera watsonii WH 0401]